jgi:hypothetical protein
VAFFYVYASHAMGHTDRIDKSLFNAPPAPCHYTDTKELSA